VAYVSQQAWVQQGTLRDNVCFGRTYNETRFLKVINACALERDLCQFPGNARDLMELGGKVYLFTVLYRLPATGSRSHGSPAGSRYK